MNVGNLLWAALYLVGGSYLLVGFFIARIVFESFMAPDKTRMGARGQYIVVLPPWAVPNGNRVLGFVIIMLCWFPVQRYLSKQVRWTQRDDDEYNNPFY